MKLTFEDVKRTYPWASDEWCEAYMDGHFAVLACQGSETYADGWFQGQNNCRLTIAVTEGV